jgi:hypothetical protein
MTPDFLLARNLVTPCLGHEPKVRVATKIINKRGEINLNKWMEKAKDSCGLVKWGLYVCSKLMHILFEHTPHMNKGPCVT